MEINPEKFDSIAHNIFAPVYPVIARQVLEEFNRREGICLDLGSGTGMLGMAVAEEAKDMKVVLFDESEEMLRLAGKYNNLPERVSTKQGVAEELPFADDSVDLIVSRGSVFFWNDQKQGFKEAYRVLKSGGCACIGGGFGTPELLKEVMEKMSIRDPEWADQRKCRSGKRNVEHFENIMASTGIPEYRVESTEAGLWIKFQKQ